MGAESFDDRKDVHAADQVFGAHNPKQARANGVLDQRQSLGLSLIDLARVRTAATVSAVRVQSTGNLEITVSSRPAVLGTVALI